MKQNISDTGNGWMEKGHYMFCFGIILFILRTFRTDSSTNCSICFTEIE